MCEGRPFILHSQFLILHCNTPRDMDARIEELFDMLGEVDYHHSMPDNRDAFLELMKEQWAV